MLVSERKPILARQICRSIFFLFGLLLAFPALASVNIPLSVTLSEVVTVTGFPQIAVDVGGTTRYAVYSSGSGTNTLTFTLSPPAGDVDLDGVTVSSPILLNGGTIKDTAGNDLASLTFTPPNTSGIKINYPSLSMDFVDDADGRYTLNGTTYNDLASFLAATGGSFTRASIGTYYDSSGILQTASAGTPRFDWDPVTHAAKGILIEEGRTNYLLRSEAIDDASWGRQNLTITGDAAIAPDGTNTAEVVFGTGVAGYVQKCIISTAGTNYVASIFLKGLETLYFRLQYSTGAERIEERVNLSAGTITDTALVGATRAGANITAIANGWYRVSISGSLNTSTQACLFLFNTNPTTPVFVWGAQVEQGTFLTSFIPTTTASVTRAADVLALPYSVAAPLSFYAELEKVGAGNNDRVFTLDDGSTNNLIQIILGGTLTPLAQITTAGSNQASVTGSSVVLNQAVKLSLRAMANNTRLTQNGISYALDNSVTMPVGLTTLRLGHRPVSAEFLMGYIKSLRVYNSALSDTQLQLLTQ